jgi:transcriptional regulator with XRE-family HTH domain
LLVVDAADAEPFASALRRLREDRGWSRERLSHEAFAIDAKGSSVAQIVAIESGKRHPSEETMASLSEALDVDPMLFPEYRLARVRGLLDERRVGLEAALENLRRLEAAEAGGRRPPALPALDPTELQRGLEAGGQPPAGNRASGKAPSPKRKRSSKKRAA